MINAREFNWSWQGQDIVLGLDEAGSGPVVLLLPALSSISTRGEMHPLMERLASQFHTMTIDWPGFGTRSRPEMTWTPNALSSFLDRLLHDVMSGPHAVVAAGHAATYVLYHAAHHPGTIARAALIAPTWRGPLPTMGGGRRPLFQAIRRAVEMRYVGPLLYRLNVNPFVVRKMVAGHVYSDAGWLTGERLAQKRRVIGAAGARFASAAFVTGALDRVASRTEFLALAAHAAVPITVVYGAETPARSRAEIEALAALPGIKASLLPRGKLSVHEEFPDEVARAVEPFFLQ
jgi:pimeloyl-ACP methyl ester carboxylesterase